jgi:hypothetical protein
MATIPAPGSYVTTTNELGTIAPRIADSTSPVHDPIVRTINESSVVTINKHGDYDMVKKVHEVRCPLSRISESLSSDDVQLLTKSIQQQADTSAKLSQSNQPPKDNLRSIAHSIQVNSPRNTQASRNVSQSRAASKSKPLNVGIGIPLNKTKGVRSVRAAISPTAVRDVTAIRLLRSNPHRNLLKSIQAPQHTRSIGNEVKEENALNDMMNNKLYSTDNTLAGLQIVSDSTVTLRLPPSKLKECTYAQDDVNLRPGVTIDAGSNDVPSKPTARPHSVDHAMILNMLGDNKTKKKKKWGLTPESSLFKSSLKKKLAIKAETDGIFSPARFYDGKKHKRFALDTHVIEAGFVGLVEIELLKYNDNRKIRVGMINSQNLDDSPIIESRKSKSVLKALAKKLANKTVISFEFRTDVIKANVNGQIAQTKSRMSGVDYIPYIQIGSKMNAKITITREGEEPKSLTLR